LAQFCIAKELYINYSKQIKKVLDKANTVHKWNVVEELAANCETQDDLIKLLEKIIRRQRGEDITVLMNLQDKAHKQCLACAKELGLTITSRLKLAIPPPPEDDDDEL
jgi:P27 family predicted phage terminase small subunit